MFKSDVQTLFPSNSLCPNNQTRDKREQILQEQNSQRCQEERFGYEHINMLREDYQGLFYRKLNYIIELEEVEQSFVSRKKQFTNNQLVAHQESIHFSRKDQLLNKARYKSLNGSQQTPILILVEQMVQYYSKMRKQSRFRHHISQIEAQVNKLIIDKQTLLSEMNIFVQRLISLAEAQRLQSSALENELLEKGKRYNLYNVTHNFISSIKEAMICKFVYETVSSLFKSANSQYQSQLKLQQLKLPVSSKNKKQLVYNFTLYLKQYHSSIIYKQLSESIAKLIKSYEQTKIIDTFLFSKMLEEISNNIQMLLKVNKQIESKQQIMMDYRIGIDIIVGQNKQNERTICDCEHSMGEFVRAEAMALVDLYLQERGESNDQNMASCNFNYFHQQLSARYKKFIINHLKEAEHIQSLKEKIQYHDKLLSSYLDSLKLHSPIAQSQSQLQTHRTKNHQGSMPKMNNYQNPINKLSCRENTDRLRQMPLSKNDQSRNQIRSRKNSKNSIFSRRESTNQFESLRITFENNERFIVRKYFTIGNQNKKTVNDPSMPKRKNSVQSKYNELKITKKYLILQPINDEALTIKQKIEVSRIKNYFCDVENASLCIDYGGCSLRLEFLTHNFDDFSSKLKNVLNKVNKGSVQQQRCSRR